LEGPHDAEAMEQSALKCGKLCEDGLDVRTKGEGSVKSNAEELESGVECKGSASQSELGLMRSLMGFRTEEATCMFSRVDWEVPFQVPIIKVIEGLLDRVGSFQAGQERKTRWRDYQHRVTNCTNVSLPKRGGAVPAPLSIRWAKMARQLPQGARPSGRPQSSGICWCCWHSWRRCESTRMS